MTGPDLNRHAASSAGAARRPGSLRAAVRRSGKATFRWATDRGLFLPLASYLERGIVEVAAEAGAAPPGAPTLLALSPLRFRKDLELLAATRRYRVLAFDKSRMNLLTNLFYDGLKPTYPLLTHAAHDARFHAAQAAFRSFLRRFLPYFFERSGVSAVLTASFYYGQDFDVARESAALGLPWIVINRENLISTPKHRERVEQLCRTGGRFEGRLLIVHNRAVRDAMLAAGYAPEQTVQALGCLRMDDFVRRIAAPAPARRRKRVTLFSFSHGVGLQGLSKVFSPGGGAGFVRLFSNVHATLGRLAVERPDVDFVIKPKWLAGDWGREIDAALRLAGVKPGAAPNLTVTDSEDAQDLILSSDVVCGFGSTTLLEAGVAGKQVVVPMFDEALKPEYQDYVILRDRLPQLFSVAGSADEFRHAILRALAEAEVPPQTMEARWDAFEEFVSTRAGDALERYAAAIDAALGRSADARRQREAANG